MRVQSNYKILFFKGVDNGPLYTSHDIIKMVQIRYGINVPFYDYKAIRKYAKACKGIEREILKPSVDYAIKQKRKVEAIKIYRYLNDSSITDAHKYVEDRAAKLGIKFGII